MKYLIIAIAILLVGAGLVVENRYDIKIHSPIVAKLDRFTGEVYIVNSGAWMRVHPAEASQPAPAVAVQNPEKPKQ